MNNWVDSHVTTGAVARKKKKKTGAVVIPVASIRVNAESHIGCNSVSDSESDSSATSYHDESIASNNANMHEYANSGSPSSMSNCPNHTPYSKDDRRCKFTPKLRKVKPEVIAVGRKLSAHDPDVLIIDTGAGQFCLKKRKFFRRGSLRPACGEQVEGATGEAQEIQSTGIAEFEIHNSVDNVTGKSHIIRTGPDAWYGSKLGFNLGSVSTYLLTTLLLLLVVRAAEH